MDFVGFVSSTTAAAHDSPRCMGGVESLRLDFLPALMMSYNSSSKKTRKYLQLTMLSHLYKRKTKRFVRREKRDFPRSRRAQTSQILGFRPDAGLLRE